MAKTELDKCKEFIHDKYMYESRIVGAAYLKAKIDEYVNSQENEIDTKNFFAEIQAYVLCYFDFPIMLFHKCGASKQNIATLIGRPSKSVEKRIRENNKTPNIGRGKQWEEKQNQIMSSIKSIKQKCGGQKEFIEQLVILPQNQQNKLLTTSNLEPKIIAATMQL